MFSYEDYREIIEIIKASGKQANFKQAQDKEKYIVMRHDVEFSVERAYALSKVEFNMDFTSTYFFQWTNNTYNILSKRNLDIMKDMNERGHIIGLHFALNGLTDMELIRKKIKIEIEMLSNMVGFQIDQFSVHRPSGAVLKENIKLPNIINAYADDYFTYVENMSSEAKVNVCYLSDANHRWNYGFPDEKTLLEHDKVQILTHPYTWTKKGHNNLENFRTLLQEKQTELIESIDNECRHFEAIRDEL